jgi:hypothetical protein
MSEITTTTAHNIVMGKPATDWLAARHGKSSADARGQEVKAWIMSKEGKDRMYTGKGMKPIKHTEDMGVTNILVTNCPSTIPLWDVRELVSAFVPVVDIYRHRYQKTDGAGASTMVIADNVRVTIPSIFNTQTVADIITEMRDGTIAIGDNNLGFSVFFTKAKTEPTGPIFKAHPKHKEEYTAKPTAAKAVKPSPYADAARAPAKPAPKAAPAKPADPYAAKLTSIANRFSILETASSSDNDE